MLWYVFSQAIPPKTDLSRILIGILAISCTGRVGFPFLKIPNRKEKIASFMASVIFGICRNICSRYQFWTKGSSYRYFLVDVSQWHFAESFKFWGWKFLLKNCWKIENFFRIIETSISSWDKWRSEEANSENWTERWRNGRTTGTYNGRNDECYLERDTVNKMNVTVNFVSVVFLGERNIGCR